MVKQNLRSGIARAHSTLFARQPVFLHQPRYRDNTRRASPGTQSVQHTFKSPFKFTQRSSRSCGQRGEAAHSVPRSAPRGHLCCVQVTEAERVTCGPVPQAPREQTHTCRGFRGSNARKVLRTMPEA